MNTRELIAGLLDYIGELEGEIDEARCYPPCVVAARGLASVEPFAIKHYSEDAGPSIKGNGFDGLRIGEDREEAEAFVAWLNARLVGAT